VSAAQMLLRRLLEQAGGAGETGFLLVIDSEGLEDLPDQIPTSRSNYAVHRVTTELGLRHLLWKAKGAPLIAVMPEELATRIQRSPDILRRARNQRVHALSVNDVLEVVLGVRVVGADAPYMQQLALEYIERLSLAISKRTLPTVIDRRLLTELLVDASVGDEVRKSGPAELLATWAVEPPRWPENVSKLVRDALPSLHGDEGRLLAWALEDPDDRLRHLLVHGALLTVEAPELPKPAWGMLWRAATAPPIEMDRRVLRRVAAALAEEALTLLGEGAADFLNQADRQGRATLTPTQLQTSRVLPLAFEDRCHSLAQQAAAGRPVSAADIAWLASHRASSMHSADMAVLEAIAQLSRYLDQPASPVTDVVDQVLGYLKNGAFADLAVLQLNRALAGSAHHHAEARKVMAAVRDRRDSENQRFAEALAAGYEGALHREGLTPLHRLWKRIVAPIWQQDQDANIYLVVMDGCSYPVFLELLHALAQDSSFPVGIQPDVEGHVTGLPALAPLPTITSHARGAITLGELPSDTLVAETVFRDHNEAKTDKARFNQNPALATKTRQLFLKGDLADGGQELLAALDNPDIAVVAAVFNAVDDQIGSSNTGATVKLAPENIMAFKPGLRAAIKAGRKVLLTADHGHSPFVDKSRRVGAGKSPRFVSIDAEAPPDGFIEIDLKGLGGPPERRAFAWRTGIYLGGPQVGFHGGCSLEEMAVPLAWLEQGGLHADEPSWWYGRGALGEPPRVAPPVSPPIVTPLPSDHPELQTPVAMQLPFEPADRATNLPLAADSLARLSADEKAVLVLLKENGTARASELASQLNKNPGRLNGLMRTLRRRLHTEGAVLFSDEVLPSGETLYRYEPPEGM